MKKYLIGTDIGTSGTKSAVVGTDGVVAGEAYAAYPLICPRAGWAEQDAAQWEDAVYQTVRTAVADAGIEPGQVAGLCVSGLFAGSGVPVGEDMRPLRNAIIWMDRRATEQAERSGHLLDEKELFRITGNRNDAYFGFNKMLWIRDHEPELWEKIRCFLPSNAFVVYALTGKITVDHTAAANIGGIYDMRAHTWSRPLMDRLGIPVERMPREFYDPEEIVGGLTEAAAEKLGLIAGIPVCAGCTDCLASVLAAGVVEEGRQAAIIGTSINWSVLHRQAPDSPELVSMPNAVDPRHMQYTYGGITAAGALTKWFRDTLAPYTETDGAVAPTTYKMLDQEAARIAPGCEGLVVLPYFMGERSPIWDSHARGIFCGLTLKHTRAHMFRAILEATAFAVRHIRESSPLFCSAQEECVVTGGATGSDLWMQILSDVTDLRILRTERHVQAPVGDALIAGVASGEVDGYERIHEWCSYDRTFVPDEERHAAYDDYYRAYQELYPSTAEVVHSLCETDRNQRL